MIKLILLNFLYRFKTEIRLPILPGLLSCQATKRAAKKPKHETVSATDLSTQTPSTGKVLIVLFFSPKINSEKI